MLVRRGCGLESGGKKQMQHLREDARRAQIGVEAVPGACAHARLLGQLALRRNEGWLVGLELAGGELPQPPAGDVAVLAQQAHALLVIDGDNRRAARMMHDLELGPIPVGENDLIGGHGDDASTEMDRLLVRLHFSRMLARFVLCFNENLPGK